MTKTKTVTLFKTRQGFQKFVVIILLVFISFQAFSMMSFDNTILNVEDNVQEPISLDGYQETKVNVSSSVIYLASDCQQLSMVTTDTKTYSIQKGIEKSTDLRPTTHDVFKDLVKNLNISVLMVKINSLEDSIFYSKLYLQQDNKILGLDSKPSDAIAIAVRLDAPVYVNSEIMQNSGNNIC